MIASLSLGGAIGAVLLVSAAATNLVVHAAFGLFGL